MNIRTNPLFVYAPLLILAAAWELVSRQGLISAYALPPLSTVLGAELQLLQDPDYYRNGLMSLSRAFTGLGLAVVIGIVIGTLMASIRVVEVVVGPIIQLFYPMPKSALIPVTILWFGLGNPSKIFLIFIGCLLPVTLSTFNGVRGVDRVMLWSAASLGASRVQVMRDVAFAGAIPAILAGSRTALALAFTLLVSAELVIANDGFGYLIRVYGDSSQYPKMFAVILSVVTLGFCADRLYQVLNRRLLRWRG